MLEDILTFAILLFLEVILSIDNVVFISINLTHLKKHQKKIVLFLGLSAAIIMRVIMLFCYKFISHVEHKIFLNFSISDVIIITGGIFLIFKSIKELCSIYCKKLIDDQKIKAKHKNNQNVIKSIMEIVFIDFVFSIDSILTAVAITKNFIMIAVIFTINIIFMGFMSKITMYYIARYNIIKIISLFFIVIIGFTLILAGFGITTSKLFLCLMLLIVLFITPLLQKKFFIKKNHNIQKDI